MGTKPTKAEKAERKATATTILQRLFPKGTTVHTIVTRVSASGMSRNIEVLAVDCGDITNVSWAVAAILDWKFDQKWGGVKVSGCGMDMAFHLVDSLGYALYGNGNTLNKRSL